jgi:single-strand DNA-binding protein
MASVNLVVLLGNVTRDPELKYMPNQTAVCDFGMAINRHWKDSNGEKKEEVTFVDLSAFGKSAENLSKFVHKGDPLHVTGRLKLDQWEAQDGTKRSKMRVIIDDFQLLGGRREPESGGYQGEQPIAQRGNLRPTEPVRRAAPKKNVPADAGMRQSAAARMLDGDGAPPLMDEDIPF